MYNHYLYLAYWVANTAILYLFGWVFPESIVLGSYRFNSLEAAFYAAFWVTFFIWLFWDFALAKRVRFNVPVVTNSYFFIVNTLSFWLVSKLARITAFGIQRFYWAIAIAIVAVIFQHWVKQLVVGKTRITP